MDYAEVAAKGGSDPAFYRYAFSYAVDKSPAEGIALLWDLKAEKELSSLCELSSVQDSFRFRCRRRALLTASYLIDERAELQKARVSQVIGYLEKQGFIPYPESTGDAMITQHILRFLKRLEEDAALIKALRRFQKPLCHRWAERLIRNSLGLYSTGPLSDADIRIAVLSACLTVLRQSVGSCFATAPALLIQADQVDSFLNDLFELLTTGKLKRTFGGVEFSVPLSPSSGAGDLRKGIGTAQLWYSPGLLQALEAAGIIDPQESLQKKISLQEKLFKPFLEAEAQISLEELLRTLIMRHYDVSDEDLFAARQAEIALSRQGRAVGSRIEESSFKRLEKCQKMLAKDADAKAAFKGFCEHPLLKAWEFTLASFSEVKMEFSRWNLYSSLGLHPEEIGGIGEVIHQHLQEKLDESNEKLARYQTEYEIAFDQVRGTEALLKQAATEAEIRRLQAEFQGRLYQMRACQEMRDRFYEIANRYSTLFSFLMRQFDAKFPEYFQEIYDAEMQELRGGLYDDSPAGFRLVYKHGRSDASQWTMIRSPEEYISALADFFSSTESQIADACEGEEGKKEILEITTKILSHLRAPAFLEGALIRSAQAHRELSQGTRGEKKPWAYTSGGTMTTLLKTYYKREAEISEEGKWVESESELLIFLLDVLKTVPQNVSGLYLKSPEKGMLISSPSHAFVLRPGIDLFSQGWQEEGFTYTWVRDQIFLPREKFFKAISLSPQEQHYLVGHLAEALPFPLGQTLQHHFPYADKPLSVPLFRKRALEHTSAALADALDAFLFEHLPLTPGKLWKTLVRRIFSDLMDEQIENVLTDMPDVPAPILSAKELRELAKGCYLLSRGSPMLSFDLHDYVARHSQYLGVSSPRPCLCADSNWSTYTFAFLVNPGTERLELWRLDPTGSQGIPMSSWKLWLNGKERKPWTVYTRPYEYTETT